jgi:hypothetical protein
MRWHQAWTARGSATSSLRTASGILQARTVSFVLGAVVVLGFF